MLKSIKGFTIVELLIVIVVIAILASVSVTAYGGIQTRALNTARMQEAHQWNSILQLYYAREGRMPNIPQADYCLGDGFPDGDGIPGGECRDIYYPPNAYHEIDNSVLMAELRTVSSDLPSGPRTIINGTIGPYVGIWERGYYLTQVYQGNDSSTCPSNTEFVWSDGTDRVLCAFIFEF